VLLTSSSTLTESWQNARISWARALDQDYALDERVPTFIVIDEAHNLAGANPRGSLEQVVHEQLRTIAAEGRKYGLFLILVSQRPDKIDPLILSECDNKALMRIDSQSVLATTERLLGLEDIPRRLLDRSLEFTKGLVLLAGRWAGGEPKILYAAARRTTEGGRGLRDEYWTVPDTDIASVHSTV
jgi:DNA helicase HerA-like ATPase